MTTELQRNIHIINSHQSVLREKYAVARIGIFGSVAKGFAGTTSDVDVVVEFSKPIGMFKFLELEEYLSELFGKKADLVTKQSLKPLIKAEILNHTVYA